MMNILKNFKKLLINRKNDQIFIYFKNSRITNKNWIKNTVNQNIEKEMSLI